VQASLQREVLDREYFQNVNFGHDIFPIYIHIYIYIYIYIYVIYHQRKYLLRLRGVSELQISTHWWLRQAKNIIKLKNYFNGVMMTNF
jgi:hypothetical protein